VEVEKSISDDVSEPISQHFCFSVAQDRQKGSRETLAKMKMCDATRGTHTKKKKYIWLFKKMFVLDSRKE